MNFIPLTILAPNPERNAEEVFSRHRSPMYKSGLIDLECYKRGLVHGVVNSTVSKWFGSEWYLYKLVEALSFGRNGHLRFEEFFERYNGQSLFPPKWWTHKLSVRMQHWTLLSLHDDIDRLDRRYESLSSNDLVPTYDEPAPVRQVDTAWLIVTGNNMLTFDAKPADIASFIRRYRLYSGGYSYFTRNNHYIHYVGYNYREEFEEKVSRNRTRVRACSAERILRIWRENENF